MTYSIQTAYKMACKKCTNPGTIILRKKDSYCNECFEIGTNHKFRACIGKNKVLCKNENVLVCLSGGLGSSVMLDLIYNGLSMDSHKKLRINPYFLHLLDGELDNTAHAEKLIEQCEKYSCDLYIVHISQYMETDVELHSVNTIAQPKDRSFEQFDALLSSMPATTKYDLMPKIKRNLFLRCARKLQCTVMFTAETTTTLAINLLSNLAMGRGSQVESDIGFCDSRDKDIKILRPMKDISQEELEFYIKIKELEPVINIEIKSDCLQSVIGAFVKDLQENFPATISTVCKTADKLGILEDLKKGEQCVICENILNKENNHLSSFQATKLSKTLSNNKPESFEHSMIENDEDGEETMFPRVHMRLCYACSRNYSEFDSLNLPNHIKEQLNS